MALIEATPREKLDRILQYVVRARRYWWLVAGIVVVGGALSVGFALTRPKVYESSAVLQYQERIQTSLLQNREVSTATRNLGERYREVLLASDSLIEIIRDPNLNPYPDILADESEDHAIEELRLAIDFRPRGASTFVVSFKSPNAKQARAITARLTELLQAKEAQLRLKPAEETTALAMKLRDTAAEKMRASQSQLNQFLVTHPEFAIDAAEGQGEGASIRASQEKPAARPRTAGEAALQALERQRARIKARIANPDAPPPAPEPRAPRVRTAAQLAADQKVAEAERELDAAESALAETLTKVTDIHPAARAPKERVAAAKSRLAAAKAAMPPDVKEPDVGPVLPAGPVDRAQLEKALADVERLIAAERARQRVDNPEAGSAAGSEKPEGKPSDWVVKLEDEYQQLQLEVNEHRERVKALSDSVFRSDLEAQQRAADSAGSLVVLSKANEPLRPTGKPKKVMVLAGLVLFSMLGCGLALGLALIDDRIYRRADMDALGVAPTLAVIPRARVRRVKKPAA